MILLILLPLLVLLILQLLLILILVLRDPRHSVILIITTLHQELADVGHDIICQVLDRPA